MKQKDLKTTYNTLCDLDYPVPSDLLRHIAERIRTLDTRARERKLFRMTEEQLIRWDNKQKRVLRIYTPDGLLIQKDTAEESFRDAIRRIGPENVSTLGLRLGRKTVIRYDATLSRRRFKGYFYLCPGYFLIDGTKVADKHKILCQIDAMLQLNWEIELL